MGITRLLGEETECLYHVRHAGIESTYYRSTVIRNSADERSWLTILQVKVQSIAAMRELCEERRLHVMLLRSTRKPKEAIFLLPIQQPRRNAR